ncbi:DNA-binding NarL/FixJ family response regulator [Mucilaginibacter sp. SG538B]|uniref:hypothetical protein n=1 Tax=Mucilaginibacter sp. SG538B TaxID=2587021 RepID=UPI00159E635F|nr:hypothetical protein [Mucilaginibacter sp. SG538B]NVM64490.1 DNA-binding NarL/FixJ family response regulator [Mucilaginibacter sp. SG538B]
MDAVLILEDHDSVIKSLTQLMEDIELPLDLIHCKTYDEYEKAIGDEANKKRIKCLIMDLSNNKSEDQSKSFKSIDYINDQYANNRIPIFVHSAYLNTYEGLADRGTVFKVLKTTKSPKEIVDLLKKFYDSGFLDIFSNGGSLENKIMKEVHNSFVEQFKSNEIAQIISSIESAEPADFQARIKEVFERIAIRSVYQNLISTKENSAAVRVNTIEHYYRRNAGCAIWTGDIFKNKESNNHVFIATPRCNLANNNFNQILVCEVNEVDEKKIAEFKKKDGDSKIQRSITDNLVGEKLRFLPRTPQFKGGYVDFVNTYTLDPQIITSNYEYVISLVDDLTNDVVRKLSTYLLRGGIADTHYAEAIYYFQDLFPKPGAIS